MDDEVQIRPIKRELGPYELATSIPPRDATYEIPHPCEFHNDACLCQRCEKQCNNGLECWECHKAGKPMHNYVVCTGFIGTYPCGARRDGKEETT